MRSPCEPSRRTASTNHLQAAPRCGAVTAAGGPCRAPACAGHRYCRWHGGPGRRCGAPLGNSNALKHGRYSARAAARRRELASVAGADDLALALVAALEAPPVLPAKAGLPTLAAIAGAEGFDRDAALTLATAPGVGVTMWRRGRSYGAAFHRLDREAAARLGDGMRPTRTILGGVAPRSHGAVCRKTANRAENNTRTPSLSSAQEAALARVLRGLSRETRERLLRYVARKSDTTPENNTPVPAGLRMSGSGGVGAPAARAILARETGTDPKETST